jgi:hypothetical protein
MKPTPQISSIQRFSQGETHASRDQRPTLLTDYSYQSTAKTVGHGSVTAEKRLSESRTFRQVSREFFGTEADREYFVEAVFFASISCVAAWPVTVMVGQLMTMMI